MLAPWLTLPTIVDALAVEGKEEAIIADILLAAEAAVGASLSADSRVLAANFSN
jgi:hypothetical protein